MIEESKRTSPPAEVAKMGEVARVKTSLRKFLRELTKVADLRESNFTVARLKEISRILEAVRAHV